MFISTKHSKREILLQLIENIYKARGYLNQSNNKSLFEIISKVSQTKWRKNFGGHHWKHLEVSNGNVLVQKKIMCARWFKSWELCSKA
jgi:hypothetical protein